MTLPPASVVVVSRGRPVPLALCLRSLAALDYPDFEVIVVADPAGCAVARPTGARVIAFDLPNISAARNIGVAAAGGEVIGFVDDDAVAEPLWLRHLSNALTLAPAATGWTRGPDGLKFWTRTASFDTDGATVPLPVTERRVIPAPDRTKIEGTNMAVRADVLRKMGGFDPALRFYMDDTDLALRLSAAGHPVAAVPLAQVHHALAPSPTRTPGRAPRSLVEIGASSATMARKHGLPLDAERCRQRARLLRWMQRGDLGPEDVTRLLRQFDDGAARPLPDPPDTAPVQAEFHQFPRQPLTQSQLIKVVPISPVFARPGIIYRANGSWCHRMAGRDLDALWASEHSRLNGIRWS